MNLLYKWIVIIIIINFMGWITHIRLKKRLHNKLTTHKLLYEKRVNNIYSRN